MRSFVLSLALICLATSSRAAPPRERGLTVVFVVDTSWLMADTELELAKEVVVGALASLAPTDRVGLCTLAGRVVEPTPLRRARGALREGLAGLRALDTSAPAAALACVAAAVAEPGTHRRVVWIGRGQMPHAPLLAATDGYGAAGIVATTVGVGLGHDAELMMALAQRGGGYYHVVARTGLDPLAAELRAAPRD